MEVNSANRDLLSDFTFSFIFPFSA